MGLIQMFDGASANGNSASIKSSPTHSDFVVIRDGVSTAGSVTLELSPDGGSTWLSTGYVATSADPIQPQAGSGPARFVCTHFRLVLSAHLSGSLNAWVGVS